jgi:excisionase family DNA binding protein
LLKKPYYLNEVEIHFAKENKMANLLNMKQVTAQLGLSERTVYRLMEEGELHPFKMGKAWKFDQSDLDAYVERLRQESEVKRGRPRGTTEQRELQSA